MRFVETPLAGGYVIELDPYVEERGSFARVFCRKEFARIGLHKPIAQINHSWTRRRATIRGMHCQLPPAAEAKIVRCVRGAVFDVMVDLRAGSPTFRQWHAVELSQENMQGLFIPEGFAHGFQTLTDDAELIYLHSEFYSPQHEYGVRFDDPVLAIDWPLPVSAVSAKDESYAPLDDDFRGIRV